MATNAALSSPSEITASAPSPFNSSRASGFRPAAITRRAPSRFAPVPPALPTPVAPELCTLNSHKLRPQRCAAQLDIAGVPLAAAVASSEPICNEDIPLRCPCPLQSSQTDSREIPKNPGTHPPALANPIHARNKRQHTRAPIVRSIRQRLHDSRSPAAPTRIITSTAPASGPQTSYTEAAHQSPVIAAFISKSPLITLKNSLTPASATTIKMINPQPKHENTVLIN